MKKRVARAEVVLDEVDVRILHLLASNKKMLFLLEKAREILVISHTSYLIHLKRLKEHGFIEILRTEKDYKTKLLRLTSAGLKAMDSLRNSPKVSSIIYKSG